MEMRQLGRTGVPVSKFCFGAGMFGYFANEDQAECTRMVDIALDAGVNYFDTSDVYSHGESEEMLGKALKGRHTGLWRYREGDVRGICELRDTELVVLVIRIAHRGSVYE